MEYIDYIIKFILVVSIPLFAVMSTVTSPALSLKRIKDKISSWCIMLKPKPVLNKREKQFNVHVQDIVAKARERELEEARRKEVEASQHRAMAEVETILEEQLNIVKEYNREPLG